MLLLLFRSLGIPYLLALIIVIVEPDSYSPLPFLADFISPGVALPVSI